ADNFSGAATDQASGTANLAARAAIDRINAAAKAARAKNLAALSSPSAVPYPNLNPSIVSSTDSEITFSDGTSIKLKSSNTLSGGGKLDLDGGTLTLSNGVQIDL